MRTPKPTDETKSSFFFNTVQRYKPNENNFRTRDYYNNYSSHNFIVYEKPTDHDKAKSYFDK